MTASTRTTDTVAYYVAALLGGFLTPKDRQIAAYWWAAYCVWADLILRAVADFVWAAPSPCMCDLCTNPQSASHSTIDELNEELLLASVWQKAIAELDYEMGVLWVDATPYAAEVTLLSNRHTPADQAVTGSVWVAETQESEDITATQLDLPPVDAYKPAPSYPVTVTEPDAHQFISSVLQTLCIPEDLAALKRDDLRQLCKAVGVSNRGTKADMIARISGSKGE